MLALGGTNQSDFMTRQFIYLISIYFIIVPSDTLVPLRKKMTILA